MRPFSCDMGEVCCGVDGIFNHTEKMAHIDRALDY